MRNNTALALIFMLAFVSLSHPSFRQIDPGSIGTIGDIDIGGGGVGTLECPPVCISNDPCTLGGGDLIYCDKCYGCTPKEVCNDPYVISCPGCATCVGQGGYCPTNCGGSGTPSCTNPGEVCQKITQNHMGPTNVAYGPCCSDDPTMVSSPPNYCVSDSCLCTTTLGAGGESSINTMQIFECSCYLPEGYYENGYSLTADPSWTCQSKIPTYSPKECDLNYNGKIDDYCAPGIINCVPESSSCQSGRCGFVVDFERTYDPLNTDNIVYTRAMCLPACIVEHGDCTLTEPGQDCCEGLSCIENEDGKTCEKCTPLDTSTQACTDVSECCTEEGVVAKCLSAAPGGEKHCVSCIPNGNVDEFCTNNIECCNGWVCQKEFIQEGVPAMLGICKSCIENDNPCDSNSDCCGKFCIHATSSSKYKSCANCIPTASPDSCSIDGACCSGICDDNKCAQCRSLGKTCSSGDECCSKYCGEDSTCKEKPQDGTYLVFIILIPILILAMLYMGSYLFDVAYLRTILQDELFQILATGAIAFSLVSVQVMADGLLASALVGTQTHAITIPNNPTASDMMGAAQNTLGNQISNAETVISGLQGVVKNIGHEASKSVFCQFLGVGFSLVNCSPLNAFRGGFTLAMMTSTAALTDAYAQTFLLSLAKSVAFTLIIPLGLMLRCFKVSRQAGGALIAIGFGFYLVYPTAIVATDALLHPSYQAPTSDWFNENNLGPGECDPKQSDIDKSRDDFLKYEKRVVAFGQVEGLAYAMLVKIIFASILNLMITLGAIRSIAKILGSEIDVSTLARIS